MSKKVGNFGGCFKNCWNKRTVSLGPEKEISILAKTLTAPSHGGLEVEQWSDNRTLSSSMDWSPLAWLYGTNGPAMLSK